MTQFSAHDFLAATNVSRETFEKLEIYAAHLVKWQKAINLVSKKTLDDLWSRHFLDSAQLYEQVNRILSKDSSLVDLGSGAGFPALVLAIMGVKNIHLIESDRRKCLFLKEVARLCDVSVTVHDKRIEECQIENIGLITARALSSLDQLFVYGEKLTEGQNNVPYLFLKGAQAAEEVKQAKENWAFNCEETPSQTDENARILYCSEVKRTIGI